MKNEWQEKRKNEHCGAQTKQCMGTCRNTCNYNIPVYVKKNNKHDFAALLCRFH